MGLPSEGQSIQLVKLLRCQSGSRRFQHNDSIAHGLHGHGPHLMDLALQQQRGLHQPGGSGQDVFMRGQAQDFPPRLLIRPPHAGRARYAAQGGRKLRPGRRAPAA